MKTNIFAVNNTEDVNKCGFRDIGGSRAVGTYDVEDGLIRELDEDKMSYEKFIAHRFLLFLGDNRITTETFEQLSEQDRKRLLRDFKESIER
jgi:hypothetical protein